MKTSLRVFCFAAMAVAASVMIAGCGSGGNNPPQSRVRVINALVGANPNVDVVVNGQNSVQNLGFGQISSTVQTNAGTNVPVTVVQAGTQTTVVANPAVNLQPSVDQLVLVSGVAGTNAAPAGVQVNALSPVDVGQPPTNGQVRFYFVNAAPFATNATFSYQVNGGAVQTNADLTNVGYLQMTPAQLPTFGSTVFTAQVGGETVSTTAFDTTGNKTYIVVLTGRPTSAGGNPSLGLQVIPMT